MEDTYNGDYSTNRNEENFERQNFRTYSSINDDSASHNWFSREQGRFLTIAKALAQSAARFFKG